VKYNIISLDDSRKKYKDEIRRHAKGFHEIPCYTVDGRTVDLNKVVKAYGLKWTDWVPSFGEAGIWLSNYLRWYLVSKMTEPLIVFEDDAIIREGFTEHVKNLLNQLPDDWDFVSLWVPDNQRIDYRYNLSYNESGYPEIYGMRPDGLPSYFDFGAEDVAKVYQGYGMVATMYSPAGGRKLLKLVKKYGLRTPVDCFLLEEAHKGALNGFAPKPDKVFVDYDWPETTIHNTELIK
jgi:GR25 family glycosyltransferase involved in LPS biosynthesis